MSITGKWMDDPVVVKAQREMDEFVARETKRRMRAGEFNRLINEEVEERIMYTLNPVLPSQRALREAGKLINEGGKIMGSEDTKMEEIEKGIASVALGKQTDLRIQVPVTVKTSIAFGGEQIASGQKVSILVRISRQALR